jgi:succinoglycan biosynthesis protein ExoL
MKITFIVPVLSHPRHQKRIKLLKDAGAQPTVLAFQRNYLPENEQSQQFQLLDTVHHGRYHRRLFPFLKALFKVRTALHKADVVYAFGLDILLLSWLASRAMPKPPKLVYEVGDIRPVMLGRSPSARFLRWLERKLLQSVCLLVVTSEAYATQYFGKIQGIKDVRYVVIENMLDAGASTHEHARSAPTGSINGSLVIGYFGVIRCHRSWEILKRVSRENEQVSVYVRGIPLGINDLESEAQANPRLFYSGSYSVPDELAALYNSVNVVWACYPYQGSEIGNWCWARTNRFYESCHFKKPMFAQAGTEDGRVVEQLGLGQCLDLGNVDKTVGQILSVTDAQLTLWKKNLEQLSPHIYTYTTQHDHLMKALQR